MVEHSTVIRGVGLEGRLHSTPVLVGMQDTDFPGRFFSDIGKAAKDRASSADAVQRNSDGYIHLLQPVQRRLQVAIINLACETVGFPRLDPKKIVSAGVVIRRIPLDPSAGILRHDVTPEAWMQNADGKFGWVRLKKSEEELDPDPAQRPALFSGQPELDRMLTAHLGQTTLKESFTPAFVAPPEVCERLQKTLVFAVIPTASSEVADPSSPPDYSDGSLKQQIPQLLLAGDHRAPYPGQAVDAHFMSADYSNSHNAADFLIFANLLQVVAIELGAFEDTVAGKNLRDALNRRSVTFSGGKRTRVGDFLAQANQDLLQFTGTGAYPSLQMPVSWDSSNADDEAAILAAAQQCLQQRSTLLAVPEGRFQDHTRLYRLRIFVRVQCEDGCHKTLWSQYSDLFEIAPWYEAAGLVGPPVPLPRPTRDFLKAAKPNVSFVVPDSLMNAIQASTPTSPSAGSGGIALSWICGFNIPIITICAFFVLNIFLTLLNIVFFWLPFVKICIPIPTAAVKKFGGES